MFASVILAALVACSSGFLLDREVCYGDLGCFNTQTIRSFSRPIVLLPDEPAKIGTKFFLYTRRNVDISAEQELSRKDVESLGKSFFDSSLPTKIIIHGFTHSAHEPWVQQMKAELLKNADMNVIAVDWRQGAGFPYTQATANIRVVAAELTKLLEFIMAENPKMSSADIHMIGHSLGAHCAGEVGTKIKRIARISGLDPAEPYFEGSVEEIRLEARDAEFVDIIHSDGSAFLGSLGMGYRSSIGHVDFYPNGGADQPGCSKTAVTKIVSSAVTGIKQGTDALKNTFACSHNRAISYYIESINGPCPFTAYPCKTYDDFKAAKCLDCQGDTCSKMGYHADKSSARGNLYLMPNQVGKSPQCSYHYRVGVTAGTMATGKGYGTVQVSITNSANTTVGPFSMTSDDVYIESNTALSRLVVTQTSLGEKSSIRVDYTKGDCLTCFVYSDFVRLQKVEISDGEQQIRTEFCGMNQSIAKDQYRELTAMSQLGQC